MIEIIRWLYWFRFKRDNKHQWLARTGLYQFFCYDISYKIQKWAWNKFGMLDIGKYHTRKWEYDD